MQKHSETAWNIASQYSNVLASETRDLAGQIDVALKAERELCAKLREALKECADDLEASVNAEYSNTLDYPVMVRKRARDMEPVRKARELLRPNG